MTDVPSVSNSEIQTFQKCRRRWWLGYYEGWKPQEIAYTGPLALGTRVHNALEAYYKEDADLIDHYSALLEEDRMLLLASGMDIADINSEGELGRLMLEGYLEWVAEEGIDANYEVIGVEEILTMPMLGGAINVIGKIDLRVRDRRDGSAHVLDHKGQPLDEVVLTTHGWEPIGKLEVGDYVIGSSWSPVRVTGVYDRGERDVYLVKFTDGTEVRCDDEHLWSIQLASTSSARVLGIQQIRESLEKSGTFRNRHGELQYKRGAYVTAVVGSPSEKRRAELLLEPYTMGAWLSDGSADGCSITDGIDERARLEFAGCLNIREHHRPSSQALSGTLPDRGRDALRRLNLLGVHSHDRFIPDAYLHASYPDRLMLARALMDGDGSFTKSGSTVYLTSSRRLADDFALLARSLGWHASIWTDEAPKYSYLGETRTGRTAYRVNITADVNPFLFSERNRPRWESKNGGESIKGRRDRRKRIAYIEPVGRDQCRCIKVDAADNLYVTSGGVLTHNTSAQLGDFESWGHMNPQLMTYMTLDYVTRKAAGDEDNRLAGGVFRILKKVKRGPRAKPPFYTQVEVRHNVFTLRAFYNRLQGVLIDMLGVRKALDEGQDHRLVAYPTPTRDCRWMCPFFKVCPMFDDGSAVDEVMKELYVKADPYDYYKNDSTPE